MAWTYRRAAGAMLVTSLTTCAAFVATSFSPLAEVKSFGLFCAFVIAVDYVQAHPAINCRTPGRKNILDISHIFSMEKRGA